MPSNRRGFLTGGVLAGSAALVAPAMSAPRPPKYLPERSPDALFPETVLNFELKELEQARAAVVEVFPNDPRGVSHPASLGGYGSGFFYAIDNIINAARYTPGLIIITNSHVVAGAETVWVRTFEGQVLEATVQIDDRASDVAILDPHIQTGVSTLKLSKSKPKFGDPIAAIGAPLGYASTVTRGFISNIDVAFRDDDPVDYIQHDAAINHGSSGGPLVDANGEVVSMNTAIPDETSSFAGIGLATPVSHIERALFRFHNGQQTAPSLGLQLQQISPSLGATIGWTNRAGLLVSAVDYSSPAGAVGIKVGDVLAEADGTRFNSLRDLGKLLLDKLPGQKLKGLKVHRLSSGKLQKEAHFIKQLTIGEQKIQTKVSAKERPSRSERSLPHGLIVEKQADKTSIVTTVAKSSAAELGGIVPGDTVEMFAMHHGPTNDDIERLWSEATAEALPVLMRRGNDRPLFVTLPRKSTSDESSHQGNSTDEISAAY
ncbi:S1C family serine protease [Ahrensia sp. R2A130]|uniref:S1C family serine protease n=1 Tax=Ahrensia sp. R2A130 TaxID=744979 RepID=UPI0001E0E097|nr:trypsin-like peptidase domain-containing protein [Ahrensia sp. R2A130]EFL89315.1 peptidase S1C, Do [Ahrensia sp. R2A130]